MNLAHWLWAAARSRPQAPALLTGARLEADYAGFALAAEAVAAALKARGIGRGDRVAILMANCTDYLAVLHGIWWAGAAAVPINAKLHGKEAAWIIGNAEAKLTFTDAKSAAALREADADLAIAGGQGFVAASGTGKEAPAAPPADADDQELAWLFYTSGTTGQPKGAMLSHGNLITMSLCYPLDVDPVYASDAALYAAPMSHGAGLYAMVHVRAGARHLVPESGGFDPAEILDLGKSQGPLSFFAAPTMVRRLVDVAEARGEDGAGIRTIVYGGGPMYQADIERALRVMGDRFVQIYGQGESPMTITALSRADHGADSARAFPSRITSVGRAHSAVTVRITDEQGAALPPGAVGEIEVRGPSVMLGYWQRPDATADSIRDGWLRTGDVGSLDEDGYLTLTDRSKDVIISGGSNVYPREVEEVLLTHPSVSEVSVFGVPDEEWGEIIVACVVPAGETLDEAALDAHCLAEIARFKRPKRYIVVEALPKNAYGKVLRRELRDRYA